MLALRPGGLINYAKPGMIGSGYSSEFLGFYGFFWTATEDVKDTGKNYVIYRQIRYNSGEVGRFSTLPEKMMSVRCVRDVTRK